MYKVIAFLSGVLILAGCQGSLQDRKEAGLDRMSGSEIRQFFSKNRSGTSVNSEGDRAQITYRADHTSHVKSGSFESTGQWRVKNNMFCAEWENREEKCFPLVKTGEKEIEVYNQDGSYRATLTF